MWKPELFIFHYMLYFTGALQWDLPVFQLVPSVWTLLREQNIKRRDETKDNREGKRDERLRCSYQRECEIPEACRLTLLVSCDRSFVSFIGRRGCFKASEMWHEKDCGSDVSISHPFCSFHCCCTFYMRHWTLRLHCKGGQNSQRWRFSTMDTVVLQSCKYNHVLDKWSRCAFSIKCPPFQPLSVTSMSVQCMLINFILG